MDNDLDDSFFGSHESSNETNDNEIRKYTIIKELGRGGMGVVYLAHNNSLMRDVAIKFVLDSTTSKRFLREAKAIASLSHPHIIKIHSLDFEDDKPYIEMEYIPGCDLKEYLQAHSCTFKQKASLLLPIVEAVAYAHRKNIIHRDIKPSNILLNEEGHPYLMDFGLAKITNIENKSLTKTGMMIGSLGYMSPEQAEGLRRKINHLSDIYCLGSVLYFVCCGFPPIRGENPLDLLLRSVEVDIVPMRSIVPDVPIELEHICSKALQKDPKNRYQSAEAFAEDLHAYVSGKSISVSKKQLWWMTYKRLVVFGSLFCILFVCVTTWRLQVSNEKTEIQITAKKRGLQSLQLGFYKESLLEFKDAYLKKEISKNDYYMYLAFVYAKLSNQELFYKYHGLTSLKNQDSFILQLAKGEILYHEKKWPEARKYLTSVWNNAQKSYKVYAGYYLGQIYFRQKNYTQAHDIFVKIKKQNTTFLFEYMALFFLGKTEYLLGENNAENLEIASKNMQYYAPTHLYLGKMYTRIGKYQKALVSLQQCLELYEDDSVYTAFGDVLQKQKKYQQALNMYNKARMLNSLNIDAINGIAQLATKNMFYIERYYSRMKKELESATFTPPDLLKKYIAPLREIYKKDYLQKQKIQKLNSSVEHLNRLLLKLMSVDVKIRDRAKKGLFLLRYNKKLGIFLAKSKPQLYEQIVSFRKKELLRVKYYILAESYFRPQIIKEISSEKLITTVKDTTERTEYRFLAALGLVRKLQFGKVRQLATKGLQKTICCAALRYANLGFDLQAKLNEFKDQFTQIITAKTLAIKHIEYAQQIWRSNDEYASFFILQSFIHSSNRLPFEGEKKLIALTTSNNSDIRSNAYCLLLSYWLSQKEMNNLQFKMFENSWLKGMKDSHEDVRLAVMENMGGEIVTPKIRTFLNKVRPNKDDTLLTKIKMIRTLAIKSCLEPLSLYYKNKNEDPIIRMYAIEKKVEVLVRASFFPSKNSKYIRSNSVNIKVFINSKNIFLRAYGHMMHSAMLGGVLHFLKEENDDNIKAAIILSSSIGEGSASSSFFKVGQKNIRKIFQYKEMPKINQQQKMKMISKFFQSNSENLRLSAYFGSTYYGTKEQRKKLVEQAKMSDDSYIKKGVAMALFFKIRDKIEHFNLQTQLEIYLGLTSFEKANYLFTREYKTLLKIERRRINYRKELQEILLLDPNEADHHYYIALVYLAENKTSKAKLHLQKAVALEERFVFFVELAKIFKKEKTPIPKEILYKMLDITSKRKVYPLILRELKNIKLPEVHQIFKQNYLFYAAPSNSKLVKERNKTWQNLISFQKNK
ncbi:protein kinase [Candidatus Uabimicrobium sp. HlEnr_7]|uniref:protein kinase domain-containing protein n=1 Tax=Candidatus Uabimicrobium helgolandensis TaxID=3095367 RepID=UPI003556C0FD